MPETMTCGRRHDPFTHGHGVEGEDRWRADATCSYCGSLSPEALFAAIEQGAELGPTDKNYKVYVEGGGVGRGKFYFQHFSAEDRARFVALLNARTLKIGYPGYFYRLPFFVVVENGE